MHSRVRTMAVVGLLSIAVVTVACSSDDPGPDRQVAVDDMLARYPGQLDAAQAGCYVDRVTDELGPAHLAADDTPSDAQVRRLTAIRVDCIGIANLGVPGAATPTAPAAPPPTVAGPQTFGDDPALDALWAACEAGDGPGCDALFDAAPLGSGYETFGATCGGRGVEEQCATAYPALPSTSTTA